MRSAEQVSAWRTVTDAVHEAGGRTMSHRRQVFFSEVRAVRERREAEGQSCDN
jgi:hypothetical protein